MLIFLTKDVQTHAMQSTMALKSSLSMCYVSINRVLRYLKSLAMLTTTRKTDPRTMRKS